MTLTASNLESRGEEDLAEVEGAGAAVAGRSPTQLAVARFRADRLSMIALGVSAFFVLCAITAPVLVGVGVLDPTGFNQHLLSDSDGVRPIGSFGGISWSDRKSVV